MSFALAALAGVLLVVAERVSALWPLAIVQLVLFAYAIRRARGARAWAVGLVHGAVANTLLGGAWATAAIQRFAAAPWHVAVAIVLSTILYQATLSALVAGVTGLVAAPVNGGVAGTAARGRFAFPATFALAWWVAEELHPLLLPWSTAAALRGATPLLQAAEVGGRGLVVALLAFVAAHAALACEPRAPRGRHLAIAAAVLLADFATGLVRMRTIDARADAAPGVRIGVVQANVDPIARARAPWDALAANVALSREAERAGASLVVWSESALDLGTPVELYESFVAARVGHDVASPVIAGALGHVQGARGTEWVNSALVIAPGGRLVARHDKRLLFPLGETLPFEGLGKALPWLPVRREQYRAGGPATSMAVTIDGVDLRVRAMICFEDLFPLLRRADAGNLLVGLTNDAWFASDAELELHAAQARLRAIELRRYFVRASNTGGSFVLDPAGRPIAELPAHAPGMVVASVHPLAGVTFYAAWGHALPFVALAGLGAFALVAAGGNRRRRLASRSPRSASSPASRSRHTAPPTSVRRTDPEVTR